jgi:hypothetical protein
MVASPPHLTKVTVFGFCPLVDVYTFYDNTDIRCRTEVKAEAITTADS